MWKFLNLWFVFHQSQPHVFAVSTEGASLACYNFFLALAQTELALFMAILSVRKAISGVAFSAQAYFTARRLAPFQVVNLMNRRGKKKTVFFLCVSFPWLCYILIPVPLVTYFTGGKNGNFNSFSVSISRIQGTSFAKKGNYPFSVC